MLRTTFVLPNVAAGGGGVGLKSPGVLAISGVAVPHTGDTAEFTFATIAVPAGAMGLNGQLRITAGFSHTNSANTKSLICRFGGTAFYTASSSTNAVVDFQSRITNRGSANSQRGGVQTLSAGGFGGTTTASVNGAVDTSVAQNITLTGTLTNAGETITLEYYTVEILNP